MVYVSPVNGDVYPPLPSTDPRAYHWGLPAHQAQLAILVSGCTRCIRRLES
jgi:hypothetical protein